VNKVGFVEEPVDGKSWSNPSIEAFLGSVVGAADMGGEGPCTSRVDICLFSEVTSGGKSASGELEGSSCCAPKLIIRSVHTYVTTGQTYLL